MDEQIRKIAAKLHTLKEETQVKAAKTLEAEATKSVLKNFEVGGRPAWIPSKKTGKAKGTKTLVVSGEMSQIQAEASIDANGVMIKLMPGPLARQYSRIHQEGGTINMPARAIRFREKKYKTGRKRTVFASKQHKRITKETMTKAYTITMPARPYLVIPPEDYSSIINNVIQACKI